MDYAVEDESVGLLDEDDTDAKYAASELSRAAQRPRLGGCASDSSICWIDAVKHKLGSRKWAA